MGFFAIDQIAKIGLSSLQVIYYFEKLFRATYWGISNKGYTGRLISEIKNTNISSVKNWKILSTIAVPRGIPEKNIKIHKNYAAKFKNIVIDNKPVKPVIHATKKANITTNSNNATIEITR
ncbi:hypothetical protein EAE89_21270 [Photorhabdus heterorhabditis]|nr:YrpD family protein [Photorhabdus heterorhabditis]MBS9444106.1 hypothetical protein [Photorhabdus heterorhabditis]